MAANDVTIVIPTLNRAPFLMRQLDYFVSQGLRCPIIVADSSDKETPMPHGLNITYLRLPKEGIAEGIIAANQHIQTKYAVVIGDDDFLIPAGIQACSDFLDASPQYVCAHGIAWAITLNGIYFYDLGLPIAEGDTAAVRLKEYLTHYSTTLFSVTRTEAWLQMWTSECTYLDQTFGDELLSSCLSVVFGKVKYLPIPYLVRQDHKARYRGLEMSDWLKHPMWNNWYSVFCLCLAKKVSVIDRIDFDSAYHAIDQAFDLYMQQCWGKYWRDYTIPLSPLWAARCMLRMIPGFVKVWSARYHSTSPASVTEIVVPQQLDTVCKYAIAGD